MRQIITMLFAVLIFSSATTIFAQAPQAFNYQGVARSLSGVPMANQNIGLQIAILKNAANGTEVYKEKHSVVTNGMGLFSIQIGNGLAVKGQMQDIEWGEGSHFIQVEADYNGGNNYQIIGTSQILSVPYALYAENGGEWTKDEAGIHFNKGNVGINTETPNHLLQVDLPKMGGLLGEGFSINRNSGYLRLINGTGFYSEFQPRISGVADSERSPGLVLVGTPSSESNTARGVLIRAGEEYPMRKGNILEVDNYTTTFLSLDVYGRLGLGTTQPKAQVHIQDGDVFIENIGSGVIMKSSNGQCWRYAPDNTGKLVGTAVNCPN